MSGISECTAKFIELALNAFAWAGKSMEGWGKGKVRLYFVEFVKFSGDQGMWRSWCDLDAKIKKDISK